MEELSGPASPSQADITAPSPSWGPRPGSGLDAAEDEDILTACDSLVATISQEQMEARAHAFRGNNFPNPDVTTVDALRWPLLPMQWKQGDYLPEKQDPKLSYELPDPSKRNEAAPPVLRGYFSTPLRDPQGDFARQVVEKPGLERDTTPVEKLGKLPPPEPETAVHLLRKMHKDTMAGWLHQEGKRVNVVAQRDVSKVLAESYRQGRQAKSFDALAMAEKAVAARAELGATQNDLRATLHDSRARYERALDRAKKVDDIETYCRAMRSEAAARQEEVLVLQDEAKTLAARKEALLAELGIDGSSVALAGVTAASEVLQQDLQVLGDW